MATPAHSDLSFFLCKYHFGITVAEVIKVLFSYDQASLKTLRSDLPNIKTSDLKQSLLILVKYQLVDYVKTVKNFSQQYEYSVVPKRVFSFFRITRFIQEVDAKNEPIEKTLLSILMTRALLDKERLIDLASERLNIPEQKSNSFREEISNHLGLLISNNFVAQTNKDLCINIERFSRNYRDNLIVEALYKYYNQEDGVKHISKAILDISFNNTADDASSTAPVPLAELIETLVPKVFKDKIQLERHISQLTIRNEIRFFMSSGSHPVKGPMYAINIGSVINYLVKEHLSSCVTTRFGPKCCRVFRVLLLRGPLLLKQIEEIIMLPARDVREYSYMLIKEGFIRNRQVPKTPDNAPGKSVFIMSVEMDQVVYGATDSCCRTISNLLMRYDHELLQNKSLLDKAKAAQEHFQTNGTVNSEDDWNQYFNSHELAQLDLVNSTIDRILIAKAQVDESLFLLHSWLNIRPNFDVD